MLLSYKCFSVWAGKLRLGKLSPKSYDSLRASVCQIFFFFLSSSGLVHPILVYHNFRIKSNLQAQRRSTCKIKSDPNYIPQTFHSGTSFSPVKIWQARLLWIYLSACLPICLSKPAAVWSQIKALSRPNLRAKLVLQVYGQKRLDRKTTALKTWQLQNLTPSKFDTSKIWQRRSVFVTTQSAPPGFYRKANLESPQY